MKSLECSLCDQAYEKNTNYNLSQNTIHTSHHNNYRLILITKLSILLLSTILNPIMYDSVVKVQYQADTQPKC